MFRVCRELAQDEVLGLVAMVGKRRQILLFVLIYLLFAHVNARL